MISFIGVVLVLSFAVTVNEKGLAVGDNGCPPWTYRHNNYSSCECGVTLGQKLKCNIEKNELQ